MRKEKKAARITLDTGIYWGLICLIPFGWVAFLASIIRRKNEVIKYGVLDVRLALHVLHNYIVGFTAITAVLLITPLYIPNIIALVAVTIAYNVVVDKPYEFAEDKRDLQKNSIMLKLY